MFKLTPRCDQDRSWAKARKAKALGAKLYIYFWGAKYLQFDHCSLVVRVLVL